jgi:DNA polymerase-3 subunit epsilon
MWFIDIETTGLNPMFHEITQLGVVSLDTDFELELSVRPLHPERATTAALKVAKQGPKTWANGLHPSDALERLSSIVHDDDLIAGHNVRFDWSFISYWTRAYEVKLCTPHYHFIDTSTLAWPLYVHGETDSLRLRDVCAHLGVSNEGEHSALADAKRAKLVYQHLMRRYEPRRLPAS